MKKLLSLLFIFALSFMQIGLAQTQSEGEQISQSFKKLSPGEEARLQAILAEPTNKNTFQSKIDTQLTNKINAANQLGNQALILALYRETVELLPYSNHRLTLGNLLLARGQIDEGNYWLQEGLKTADSNFQRAYSWMLIASAMLKQNDIPQTWAAIEKDESILMSLIPSQTWQQRSVARNYSSLYALKSELYERKGQFQEAIIAASQAIQYARQAVAIVKNDTSTNKLYAHTDLADKLARKFKILITAHQLPQAEAALQDYLRVFQEIEMPSINYTMAFGVAAKLRFDQREFAQAEALEHHKLALLKKAELPPSDPRLTNQYLQIAIALIGQHRYPEALAQFNKLDEVAGTDPKLQERVHYAFDRAVVYLYNNKALEAKSLLTSESTFLSKQYGATASGKQHFFTAQASGLQGVALWRIGTLESKAQAYPLLQAAVRDIMAPENMGYLENVGIRKELREMIFSAYIEAASQTSPADALAALGIADWLRGGLVQEALGDAAIRAAASNASLADLVRQDQDARNEIKGLRNYLSGEAGGTSSSLPQVAAQMRERIALLEKSRADVQVKIKASFPDYERLVRPLPPSTAEIQARLKADEALIVLQPTDDAVFVWAVNQNGTGAFHRANLSNAELTKLFKRLRNTLDVAGIPENRRPAFDHAAAQELYAKLLSPVQQGLAGKTSLIVAAGGVLGQIPFGVLQTADKDSWLIKQAAITHVPSVAAWLSMRSLPHQTASQPMLAWGDPLFNIALASNAAATKGEVRKVDFTRQSTSVDLEKEDPRSAIKYANIPSLPETRDELTAIAKTLGADVAKDLILGSAATRESVLAQNKNGNLAKQRVVAFATHGLMAGDLPNLTQPALAMAGTKDDATNVLAPLLTLEDVLTLKLNADWVVLSACNTAAADGKAEEALSGIKSLNCCKLER